MQYEQQEQELDLREIIHILTVRWWIIAIFTALSIIITGFVTFTMIDPVYKAETSLFVGKESDKIASLDLGEFNLNKSLVSDYRQLILSRLVSQEVIDELGLDMTVSTFQKKVEVTTIEDSRLFKISFESTDPKMAMDVANALAQVLVEKAQDIIQVKNIKIIDEAELPENPIKPNKIQNLLVAAVLGAFIGAGAVILVEYLDYTIKNANDVERLLKLNTIGEIPQFAGEKRGKSKGLFSKRKHSSGKKRDKNAVSHVLITITDPKAPASEAYRSLRTNIGYSGIDKQVRLIVLTSSRMAEGKSTTAANMAVSMAQSGKNVLLIDADLRKPRVHRYFNLSNDIGLTDIVVKNVSTEEAIKKFSYVENLSIICSGSVPPNPTEILESKKLAELLQELKEKFDIVIIDTPPVGQLTDGAILASMADGVILVAASGESNIDMVRRARAALMQVNANIIGVVLTKIDKTRSGSYYTYYNYDKYYGSED